MTREANVVIVGAGPVGLFLAIELVLAGVSVTLLERLLEPDETIKAGAIGALAGEALVRRGMGPAIDGAERAMAERMTALFAGRGPDWRKIGGHFAGLFLIDQSRQREPERRLRGVNQIALERALGERARALGVEVLRGHEVDDFRDDGAGVSVLARGPRGEVRLRCAYLVGCDGGRSLVRKTAGFAFPGTDPTITGHQAMVELDHPEKLMPLGWRRTPTGMMAFGPVPGRVFVVEFDGPPADRDAPVTLDEVQRSLRHVSGTDVTITSMKTATRFTDNARQAASYRSGRVLLAGDAAHVHSPFGGQGLNLGLLDAANLGWKLAASVRGTAPPDLLDTYTSERHPVAAAVLANTRAQVALMRPDDLTTALRDIVTNIMNLDEGNRFFGDMMSGLSTRYEVGPGPTHPRAGTLAADCAVEDDSGAPSTLYEQMQQGHAVVVDAGTGHATSMASAWPRARTARTKAGTSMFVRPDGCLAWAADHDDTAGLRLALERWLGAPATTDRS